MLTESAFNALLLTLEEPPSHVVFILATTDIQDVPITILSRCQRFDFKPVNMDSIIGRLTKISKEESIKITPEAMREIALISAGGMRDALGMLDQLSSDDNDITLDMVSNYFGSVSSKKIDELLTSIEKNDTESLLYILGNIKESGTNYSVFIEKLITELRKCAIDIKSGKTKHDMYFDDIYQLIFDLNECLCNININVDPYILIEIVLLKYVNMDESNEKYFLGNKKSAVDESMRNNRMKESLSNMNQSMNKEPKKNKEEIVEVSLEKDIFNQKKSIDISVRINNCFVNASKDMKNKISSSWVDFMNFMMSKDRAIISLLADTVILAASDNYVLIQSKISTTNELINNSIHKIETFYSDFSGNKYKFAAIDEDLWRKETEKYRFNLKNKIKYSYINEEDDLEDSKNIQEVSISSEDYNIETVAQEIFGTFEVE